MVDMPVRATVLIPTFNHGPTLRYAVESALEQTVEDFELFIVGDGSPDVTRGIVKELSDKDRRVRFFDNDKGPRHGEVHRAAALREASGDIVCYLSDDDLWLPDHLQTMLGLLERFDFAHVLPLRIEPDGSLGGWSVDLSRAEYRDLLLTGENRVPFSCSGHKLAAYRRLPYGWRTTPPGVPTDLYMFQQFLSESWVRAVSGTQPTCLHFPSPDRRDQPLTARVAELEVWAARVRDEVWRRETLPKLALAAQARGWALTDTNLRSACAQLESLHRAYEGTFQERESVDRELQLTRARLFMIETSRTWKLRQRLLALPVLGPILEWMIVLTRRPDRARLHSPKPPYSRKDGGSRA